MPARCPHPGGRDDVPPTGDRLSDEELAELVAFADGTLDDPIRRAAVAARVAAFPELAALVEEQRAVAAMLREATVEAPPELRARVLAARQRHGGV